MLCICKELIVVLCYKIRMFGVPLDGLADVFCDNRVVLMNAKEIGIYPTEYQLPCSLRGGCGWHLNSRKGIWRNKLSGFIDKDFDGTMMMGFMPLYDVVMFEAQGFPLSIISKSTALPAIQVVTSQAGSISDSTLGTNKSHRGGNIRYESGT